MLSRKVIDLLGNHLLPASTAGARIFFAPISHMTECFILEKIHGHEGRPQPVFRQYRSTSGCFSRSTSNFRSWFSTDHKLASEGGPQASSPSVYCRVTEVSHSSYHERSSLGPILKFWLEMPLNTSVNSYWSPPASIPCKRRMLNAKRCLEKEKQSVGLTWMKIFHFS